MPPHPDYDPREAERLSHLSPRDQHLVEHPELGMDPGAGSLYRIARIPFDALALAVVAASLACRLAARLLAVVLPARRPARSLDATSRTLDALARALLPPRS